ncbi:MAG TPA: DUF1573 domain-containing protein [Pseudolabrys sp.]|nr:DUF1573 domain-containing protein [Pseudolabrys sp.]
MRYAQLVVSVAFAASVFAAPAVAQTAGKGPLPVLKFNAETHNFGKIRQGKPTTTEFVFANVGEAPLIIGNVTSNCGCLIVDSYTKTPIKKGDKGTIRATHNAAAPGTFSKNIIVQSNSNTPQKYLTVTGEVTAGR